MTDDRDSPLPDRLGVCLADGPPPPSRRRPPLPGGGQQGPPFWQRPRALYLAVFVWVSLTGGRFLASFLEREAGVTAATLGGLLALQKATSVVASSPCGMLADRTEGRHPGRGRQYVLGGGAVLGTLCFCANGCQRAFPTVPAFRSVFWYAALRVLYAVCVSLVFPVMDGICLDFLKRRGTPADYGKERLFGAVSWAVTNLCIGPVLDRYQDFAFLYPAAVAGTLLVLLAASMNISSPDDGRRGGVSAGTACGAKTSHRGVKRRTSDLQQVDDVVDSHTDGSDDDEDDDARSSSGVSSTPLTPEKGYGLISLCSLFGTSRFSVAFLTALVTLAAGQSIVNDLVFLFFEYLGSSFTLMSLTVVLTVAFEIPIFHVAPRLLEACGPSGLVFLASASYVLRVLAYTLVPEGGTAWVLLLEPLHGVTYACSQTAAVDFAGRLLPERGREATGQGFLQLFTGLGSVLGLVLGGWMEDAYGPRWMYRVSALVVLIGSGILGGAHLRLGPCCRENHDSEDRTIRHHIVPQHEGGEVDCQATEGGTIEMTSSQS